MVLVTGCSNLLFTFDLVRKCHFVFLMKAQITRKWIELFRPLYMHFARTRVEDTSKRFKTNEDIFRNERCKVTFGVKYLYNTIKCMLLIKTQKRR